MPHPARLVTIMSAWVEWIDFRLIESFGSFDHPRGGCVLRKRHLAVVAAAVAVAVFGSASPASADWIPAGSEPTAPYAQPTDANVPKRGCATTVADPKAPPAASMP